MDVFFRNVLTAGYHGSIVILAVMLLRLVLRKTPKKFICYLWVLAGLRLLMPIPLESRFSLQPQSITLPISVNLVDLLPVVWIAVAAILTACSILSYLRLRRQVMDAVKIPGGWESDKIETAFVLGFIKPKIYIPTGMSKDTRQQILSHERTHLEKGDHWIKLIGFLALTLHWYNPLVWVSYILLCKDIEMACDERVVQFMELNERKAYSSALIRCSTNRVHYAACPVAFGEISVKNRIKSVLNYRKPGFWVSLLGIAAICFVAVCLVTSPQEVREVPVDSQELLAQSSRQDPVDFTPAQLPTLEPNPDWGVEVYMDVSAPTGGTMVYQVEERFAAALEGMNMEFGSLDRWNGSSWEPIPSLSGESELFDVYHIGFAQSRDSDVYYFTQEMDWTLNYGTLPAGDYRITQTISSDTESAPFCAAFHIYREQLPTREEESLARCSSALDTLISGKGYSVLFYEENPEGTLCPVRRVTKSNGNIRIDHFMGEYCVSSGNTDTVPDWADPFRLKQNRQFLFPEGQSVIGEEEVTFHSVWADYQGTAHRGQDTFRFYEDGELKSVERLTETVGSSGEVLSRSSIRMESARGSDLQSYTSDMSSYTVEDSYVAMNNSPWKVFFRVDDDLLKPGGGEVWLATDIVGVSNITTDGSYWLEKKVGSQWERLGGEDTTASFGEETLRVLSDTTVRNADWTDVYGNLDAGVYRMGKFFYQGNESIIQYAEFSIAQVGGVFGPGGEEALARVDDAIEKLQSGSYRVEQSESVRSYGEYSQECQLSQVIWKYGPTIVTDYYRMGAYSHSAAHQPGDSLYGDWSRRSWGNEDYDCYYFPEGYSVISDREIRFVYSYSQSSSTNPCDLYTYRFDEEGNLTEIVKENCDGMWKGCITRYVITDTPESEIQAWVEQKLSQQ